MQKKDRLFSSENLNNQIGISLGACPGKTQPINIAFSRTTFLTIFSLCIEFAAKKWQQYVTQSQKQEQLTRVTVNGKTEQSVCPSADFNVAVDG